MSNKSGVKAAGSIFYLSSYRDRRSANLTNTLSIQSNFVANVYSYVVTQRRTSDAGDVADSNIDLAAIFGAYGAHTVSETKFRDNMERIFYTFVRSGALPPPDR